MQRAAHFSDLIDRQQLRIGRIRKQETMDTEEIEDSRNQQNRDRIPENGCLFPEP